MGNSKSNMFICEKINFFHSKYKYKTIKIMFDHSSSGIWGDFEDPKNIYGGLIYHEELRINKRTSKLLYAWIKRMDILFSHNGNYSIGKSIIYEKIILRDSKFINLENDLIKIKFLLKKQFPKIIFIVFDERRYLMNKKIFIH